MRASDFTCPLCGAPTGEPCSDTVRAPMKLTVPTVQRVVGYHDERIDAALASLAVPLVDLRMVVADIIAKLIG